MTQYYVIREHDADFYRTTQFQQAYTEGDWTIPDHYWDTETEEIIIASDAFVRFITNSKWLADDTVIAFDKGERVI